jgi:putative acetyltransferase
MKFSIRSTSPADAQGMLEAYHSAVHVTAARDYPPEVLRLWSPIVDESRVVAKTSRLEQTLGLTVMSYVAVAENGEIIGLGELVPPDTLGAVYVAASASGKGVASALLRVLEARARELGMKKLRMESSLTAAPFYALRGFQELGRDQHQLGGGLHMACVRMEKSLSEN